MSRKLPKLANIHCCTGCRACKEICSMSAITMKADKHGFFFPVIDQDLCIGCKRCEKICTVNNRPIAKTQIRKAVVGFSKSADLLSQSSSGGAFSAVIAAWKPDAVCGVRWDGFRVINDIAYSEDSIKSFSKSKYILSDTNGIFKLASKVVNEGKKVIFSGTPCQVAAFRNMIGEHDNVLLVDIVCHGAPSQKIFDMHLAELEEQKKKKIIRWSFRDKTPINGVVSSRSARVDYEDGSWQHFEIGEDSYLCLYYNRVAYREACGNCIFAEPERVSDITLCDAHHIEELYPDMTVEKGTSTILFHSEKGLNLLSEINDSMYLREVEYDWVVRHNQQLCRPTTIHPHTNLFFQMIDSGVNFDKAVKKAIHRSIISRAVGRLKKIIG